jgi:hypothetical protein
VGEAKEANSDASSARRKRGDALNATLYERIAANEFEEIENAYVNDMLSTAPPCTDRDELAAQVRFYLIEFAEDCAGADEFFSASLELHLSKRCCNLAKKMWKRLLGDRV